MSRCSQSLVAFMVSAAVATQASCTTNNGAGAVREQTSLRDEWRESDVQQLLMNERIVATIILLSSNAEVRERVFYMDEVIEIILGRPETPDDYETGGYRELSSELSYVGFRSALRELLKRQMAGQLALPTVLQNYPDIEQYVPRDLRGGQG